MIKLSDNGKLFAKHIGTEFFYVPEAGCASGILTEKSTHTINFLVTQMFKESGLGDVLCGIGDDGAKGFGQPRVVVNGEVATLNLKMRERGEVRGTATLKCDLRIVVTSAYPPIARVAAREPTDREWVEIYRSNP